MKAATRLAATAMGTGCLLVAGALVLRPRPAASSSGPLPNRLAAAVLGVPIEAVSMTEARRPAARANRREPVTEYKCQWTEADGTQRSGRIACNLERQYVTKATFGSALAPVRTASSSDLLAAAMAVAERAYPGWPAGRTLRQIAGDEAGQMVHFEWRDGDESHRSGASALVTVDARSGRPVGYMAYYPPERRVSAKVTREEALAAWSRTVAASHKGELLGEPVACLVDASRQAPREGPIWRVYDSGPIVCDGETHVEPVSLVLDAVTGAVLLPPERGVAGTEP